MNVELFGAVKEAPLVGPVRAGPEVWVQLSTGNRGVTMVVLVGCGDVLLEDIEFEVAAREGADVEVNVVSEVAIEVVDVVLVTAEADDTL